MTNTNDALTARRKHLTRLGALITMFQEVFDGNLTPEQVEIFVIIDRLSGEEGSLPPSSDELFELIKEELAGLLTTSE